MVFKLFKKVLFQVGAMDLLKRPPLQGRAIGSKTLRDKCMVEQVLNCLGSEW